MQNNAFICLLWPKHYSLLSLALAKRARTLYVLEQHVTESLKKLAQSSNCQLVTLESLADSRRDAQRRDDAEARALRLRTALSESGGLPEPWNSTLLTEGDADTLDQAMRFIDILDTALASQRIEALLVSEEYMPLPRIAVQWAKARDIPVVHICHGANLQRMYTVHMPIEADVYALTGERAGDPLIDIGARQERLIPVGSTHWEEFQNAEKLRPMARKLLGTAHGFDVEIPLLVFGTTWAAGLTAFGDDAVYDETIADFLRACAELRRAGRRFTCVIKDRAPNVGFAQGRIAAIAARLGLAEGDYLLTFNNINEWMLAADVVVSVESTLLIEAMLAGAAAVNLWHDTACILGPAYAARDGVLQAYPETLAGDIAELLDHPDQCASLADQARAALSRFMVATEPGESALRMSYILDALALPEEAATTSVSQSIAKDGEDYVWRELSKLADADLKGAYHDHPRKDLLTLLERPPQRVLDVGCATGATGELIKTAWPSAHVTGIELNRAAAARAVTRIDRVIGDPLEKIDFAAHGIAPGSIDTLILADVLEHLYDPWDALLRLHPLLAKDAQVLVSLPNARNLWLINELSSGRFPYAPEGLLDITHIRWFTRAEMERMLRETGYKVLNSARVAAMGLRDLTRPAGSTHVETEKIVLKNVSDEEFEDLKALQIMFLAKPVAEGESVEAAGEGAYELWRLGHSYLSRDALWISERIEAMAIKPSFHLAVLVPEGGSARLASNIKALGHQFYDTWRLTIIADEPVHPALVDHPLVHWHQASPDQHLALANRIFLESDADWLGLWEAGDKLAPHALFAFADRAEKHPEFAVLYSDEDQVDDQDEHSSPFFKCDFNLEMLRAAPYAVGGLLLLRQGLFRDLGGFDAALEGAEAYDLLLRAWEQVGYAGIGHLADILYHRYTLGGHCRLDAETVTAAQRQALAGHLARRGLEASLEDGLLPGTLRVRYKVRGNPMVSILIPTRNQVEFLRRCITSVVEITGWENCEIIVLDNGSDEAEAIDYLRQLRALNSPNLKVLDCPGPFNFSAMNNRGAREARGEYLLLLNNDTAALYPDWLEELLIYAQQPDVGVVGAKLHYPDGRIQHAGVILGIADAPADHPFQDIAPDADGYFGRLKLPQEYSAVTAACMLTRKAVYEELGGLDETDFKVSFNDVDFCVRALHRGYRNIFTPYARLLHEGSVSQRSDVEKQTYDARKTRFRNEQFSFVHKWRHDVAFDRAYNRNLTAHTRDFGVEILPCVTWDPEWRPRPRILAHPADRFGCGEYRIIGPMRVLNESGRVMGWETGNYLSTPELIRMAPESIVLQRQVDPHQIELMDYYVRFSQAFMVYEIDDLITNIPIKSIRKKHFVEQKDLHKRFRKGVSMCHRFIVSTDYLAEQYKGYNDDIVVVPNYLENMRWGELQPKRRGGAKARVGWAGSVTHDGDLAIIFDVVKATAKEVDWVFLGMCPDAIKPFVTEFHQGVKLDEYPAKLASLDLDLAVAPLEDVPFNHGKSHLRLLEYGILGFPVICTDLTPYRGDYPVTRVANRFKDWVEAIREHVAERDALAKRGDELRDYMRARWMIEDHLDDWLRAWLP